MKLTVHTCLNLASDPDLSTDYHYGLIKGKLCIGTCVVCLNTDKLQREKITLVHNNTLHYVVDFPPLLSLGYFQ